MAELFMIYDSFCRFLECALNWQVFWKGLGPICTKFGGTLANHWYSQS